ncbi:MAG: hypothetical protein IPH84_13725 [Bacteroidales bacterium]|nr:hypothetical protein [Bacteroidales bacterium]
MVACTGANGGFNSVCFPDASNGYAVGGNKVIKTTDAGSTWSQLMSAPSDASLNSVFFIDAENGYATGNQFINGHYHGIILKTTDGGSSWTSTSMASPGLLKSICFPEPETGYAVGRFYTTSGIIYKTDDGGASWTVQSTYPDRSLQSVFFNNLNTGYAVGEDGLILMTPNGGGHVGREEAPPATSTLTVHPNPFRERIVIEYEIKNNSSITATIHNHLGQQLRVLVNEYQCKGNTR